MPDDVLSQLLSEQTARGAFPSIVESNGEFRVDETCFVTAQIALIMSEILDARGSEGRLTQALGRALDFVETCESAQLPGAFLFYPEHIDSPRLPIRLDPDGDDTALAWFALMRGGRRSRAEARTTLPALFARLRARATQRGDAPWVRSGVYRTWFDPMSGRNPADLCVNMNILAVLAEAGCLAEPEPNGAAQAVNAACRTLELSRSALRSLAPFYADPTELAIALERAVGAGVIDLMPAWSLIAAKRLDQLDCQAGRPEDRPLYCNAHGRPLWRSPSLQRARRCQDNLRLDQMARHVSFSAMGGGNVLHH
jgi:hypothetical protein